MTPRGRGLLVAAGLLWVVARSFGVGHLQMAAVAALALVAGSVLWVRLHALRVTVRRTLTPTRVRFGGDTEVRLELRNTGRLSTPALWLDERVPAGLGAPASRQLPALRPGHRLTVTTTLVGRQRGRHSIGPVTLCVQDPFGVATRTRTLEGVSELIVHPPIRTLPPGLPLGGAPGATHSGRRSASLGEELADIREYVRGDDLRAVHWPSTARRGTLMVRRDEAAMSPSAVIVLDRRADRHRGRGPDGSLEAAVSAAASAGAHLDARGRAVVVLDEALSGPPQAPLWERSLDALATVTAGAVDLRGLLAQLGEGMAGNGTLVVVTTLPTTAELLDLVRAGHGFATRAAVLVDAASHASASRPTGPLRTGQETGTGPGTGPGTGAGSAGIPVPGSVADPDGDARVAALRAAGWRASILRHGDRLEARWRELTVASRTSPLGAPTGARPGAGR